ncbi:DUF218 domain-containing protein [Candidatus Gracilibacteria bacterium]|nr:DUF218 domain-containing protein [Candidatus Gracilibacteria bacterium]NJS40901.1 DUF218 domain-containing protein [Candidatus Gracilibacteria bacterium]
MIFKLVRKLFIGLIVVALVVLLPIIVLNIRLENFEQPEKDFPQVAIVLGAGILGPNTPSKVLQKRLDIAVELYNNKTISKVLVSGDNSAIDYNEPRTMINYLKLQGIPETDIVADYAGIRTIESCWRARNVFGLKKAYLITQRFHLPRALYLCENMGIETIPLKSNDSIWEVTIRGYIREIGATWKAVMEVNSYRGETVGDGNEVDLGQF